LADERCLTSPLVGKHGFPCGRRIVLQIVQRGKAARCRGEALLRVIGHALAADENRAPSRIPASASRRCGSISLPGSATLPPRAASGPVIDGKKPTSTSRASDAWR
jgi:hypothetical protein